MKYEHKAIVQRATRDGLLPMELAEELMGHDLLDLMLVQMKKHAVAFKNMSEIQQDAAIAEMQDGLKEAIKTAVSIIGAQATKTVRLSLKSCAVGKKLKVTGEVSATEEWKHELLDAATDQADVLVILNERDFLQGMDAHRGEKQQKSLPIDEPVDTVDPSEKAKPVRKAKADPKPKAEAKPVVIEAEMLDKARDFVVTNKNASIAGLQNRLSIGFNKANALLSALAAEGIVEFVGSDLEGGWEMVTAKKVEAAKEVPTDESESLNDFSDNPTELTEDLLDKIRAKAVRDGEIYASGLIVSFDLSEALATQAIERLELEGFISPEDDMGLRLIIGETA